MILIILYLKTTKRFYSSTKCSGCRATLVNTGKQKHFKLEEIRWRKLSGLEFKMFVQNSMKNCQMKNLNCFCSWFMWCALMFAQQFHCHLLSDRTLKQKPQGKKREREPPRGRMEKKNTLFDVFNQVKLSYMLTVNLTMCYLQCTTI